MAHSKAQSRSDRLLLAVAFLPPIAMLVCILLLGVNVPTFDDWRWVDMVVKFDSARLSIADLWQQNNEHRMLIPSLIALALSRAGGYDVVVEMLFSLLCGVATLFVVFVILRRTVEKRYLYWLLAIDSILIFSLGQAETYLWGFQLAWVFINLLAFIVIEILSRKRLTNAGFATALAVAITASISSAQGLALLPIGWAMVAVRRPFLRSRTIVWALLSVATVALYFYHFAYNAPAYSYEHVVTNQFIRIPALLVFLGAPVAGWSGTAGQIAAGTLVLAFVLRAMWTYADLLRRSPEIAKLWTPWIAIAFFGVLGGVMVAIGRAGLGLESMRTERYLTLATMTWVGSVALATLKFRQLKAPAAQGRARFYGLACAAILGLSLAVENIVAVPFIRSRHDLMLQRRAMILNYRHYTDAALIDGLFPYPPAIAAMRAYHFPGPTQIRPLIEGLERYREGPFARP